MYSSNLGLWMYNGGAIHDRPSDLAYTMGYLICKSFYEKSANKKEAVQALLQTAYFTKIIKGSAYAFF